MVIGKSAVVTGGGHGIGRAIVMALAGAGAKVLVNDLDATACSEVAAAVRLAGGEAVADCTAVGAGEGTDRIIDSALTHFGAVDILVNNAGISRPAAFGEDSDADVAAVLATNLLGPYRLMRAAWPFMKAQGGGQILNMASSAALGSGISGAYAAAKAGLLGLTREAAESGRAHRILVNALMPTASTRLLDQHPDASFRRWMKRHFDPGHVAATVLGIVGRGRGVTGRIFTSGGGLEGLVEFTWTSVELREGEGPALLPVAVHPLRSQADLQSVYAEHFPDELPGQTS